MHRVLTFTHRTPVYSYSNFTKFLARNKPVILSHCKLLAGDSGAMVGPESLVSGCAVHTAMPRD